MPSLDDDLAGLSAPLSRTGKAFGALVAALEDGDRTDLKGLPPGAAALLLVRAQARGGGPVLVMTPDAETARSLAADLRFFSGTKTDDSRDTGGYPDVLVYPAADTTPYADVAPDRRTVMERLSVLFHLAHGLPLRFLVVAAPAIARRIPPREAIARRSMVVRAEAELDRDACIAMLASGGYLRVPVAEDPGTFAVRGHLIDVYPPHARYPVRIELDDWLVLSIKRFDPDDQRTKESITEVFLHPARDVATGDPEALATARRRVRDLCDAVDLPTQKTRRLLEDLESGRLAVGLDGLLPAFYDGLDDLFSYLPAAMPVAVLDPTRAIAAIDSELTTAAADLAAKRADGEPAYDLDRHYVDGEALAETVHRHPLWLFHRLAVAGTDETGAPGEDAPPSSPSAAAALSMLESNRALAVTDVGAEDQAGLRAALKMRRTRHAHDRALEPLAERCRSWLDAGLRVLCTARTQTQAERLIGLLRAYDLPVATKATAFQPDTLTAPPSGKLELVIGDLGHGFILPSEALAIVTEEEIFGTRAHRRREQRPRKDKARAFLADLRELLPGDYVVHIDHGVGRYLGLERKTLGQSQMERMRGHTTAAVEVLLIEYQKGDRLFLPVTRLNQIEKFAGKEGHEPKLDRLGGQTFSRTKGKVRKAVREMADKLLSLYAERMTATREPLPAPGSDYAEFEATFPFEETPDQGRAIDEVLEDLEKARPMDRVVCGDVGFGKTEIAIRAAFRVAAAGRQVAVLCPTTVLAQQHYLTFRARLADQPLQVKVLSRFVPRQEQTEVLKEVKDGKVDILIGTHRVLSKDIHFKNLGLLVVDEEQRFGVVHKERMKQLRKDVDVLTLTATPIPRTLQLAVGGLRDLSLIATAPADRRAVRTFVARWDEHLIGEAIRRELARGGQVFFVHNRIEGLYERAGRIEKMLGSARVAVGHGQMKEQALERVMADFIDGRYDVLCSTAIIENGIDIPRANTIIIDRADTFGLAQLYQLRGRVGRSPERAYCYLLTPPPSQLTDDARFRIEALERFTELGSGFQVASLDMELRGAGDLLGSEQSGNVALVGFDLFVHMLEEAVAELRGEPVIHEVDTELTLDVEHSLPEDYIGDVGIRLSLYKRLASADDEQTVGDLGEEMEDRFGPPPPTAQALLRAMALKPALRRLNVLGCEASGERVTLHLREDTPLDPAKVMAEVVASRGSLKLTPDMRLTRRFEAVGEGDSIDRIQALLTELSGLLRSPA